MNLEQTQKRLNDAGIRDVKFFWDKSAYSMPKSILSDQLCFLLNTYLDGYKVPLEKFNDNIVDN